MKKILVIGDAIIDHYLYGYVNRMSPEDPTVPILDFEKEEFRLGGCLNVAANIKSLCPNLDVHVTSIIQNPCSELLAARNIQHGKCYHLMNVEAIKKTRIIDLDTNKQIIRLDNKKHFDDEFLKEYHYLLSFLDTNEFDCIVISDYDKGIINDEIIQKLKTFKGTIFVDTKNPNIERWSTASKRNGEKLIFKMNHQEWCNIVWPNEEFYVIVTEGPNGAHLYERQKFIANFDTETVQDAEVTGAGDVFLSGLVVNYLKSESLFDAIKYANKVATESVKHYGTVEVNLDE